MSADLSTSPIHTNRVAIIGCGRVGMAGAYALAMSEFVREIVLVDRDPVKAEGEAMDLQQAVAVPMNPPIKVTAGGYADAAQSSIVVITSGAASKDAGTDRLQLLEQNAEIVGEIVDKLKAAGFSGVMVISSNPVDVLTQVAQARSGLPPERVIGTGTLIDTARLRGVLGGWLSVEPRAVDASMIGEHGESEVAVWSGARVAGVPLAAYPKPDGFPPLGELLLQVRNSGPEIVKKKGHTEYAVGLCIKRICEAVMRDERAALSVSTLLTGQYDLSGVVMGTPCIIGKNGLERVVASDLSPAEKDGAHACSKLLKEAYTSVAPT